MLSQLHDYLKKTYLNFRCSSIVVSYFHILKHNKKQQKQKQEKVNENENENEQDIYYKNFEIKEEQEIKDFFEEHGFVIIRNVLSHDDCLKTRTEIENSISPTFKLEDPTTQDFNGFNNYGMWTNAMFTPQMLENRQNPNLYKAFSLLYNDSDLLINHDSACVYRATKPILNSFKSPEITNKNEKENGEKKGNEKEKKKEKEMPERSTFSQYPDLHIDFHPAGYLVSEHVFKKRDNLTYNTIRDWMTENNLLTKSDGLQLAGVINLYNNRSQDGGFHCSDGFIASFDEWLDLQTKKKKFDLNKSEVGSYYFSAKDKIDMMILGRHEIVRASAPEGALIIWNQLTAHGSQPNKSERFRCSQFVKVFKKSLFCEKRVLNRKKALQIEFRKINFTPSKIGKILFDF